MRGSVQQKHIFSNLLESCKEKMKMNSILILTAGSDFYQYIKQAIPGETQSLSAPVSRGTTPCAGNAGA
jgi:hypothetical protein